MVFGTDSVSFFELLKNREIPGRKPGDSVAWPPACVF
jgi:hypothetical protein